MKAVLARGYGDVNQLSYGDTPDLKPGSGEVLVRMFATSINPIDWKLRRGDLKAFMPLQFPAILGRDLAGEVVGLGDGVKTRKIGDRVLGLVNHAYAEYVLCKAEDLALIPSGLSFERAAALPLVVLTGAQLIEKGVRPRSGETILITGAVGGVGRTAVHVARQHGAHVIAGVRSTQKKAAEGLGADRILALDNKSEIASLQELDAVADTVGHEVITALIPHIKKNGVLATVLGKPEAANGRDLRIEEIWAQPDSARLEQLAYEVAAGKFSIPIRREFKLSDIRYADPMAEKGGIGKIILVA
ncbi:MAG: NADP-dependent oxidoreductase [Candidatus Sulfotelmatobacter sp.]|jgi:NADPH:quinone reductase-like Zn-dependent oxidoreductase